MKIDSQVFDNLEEQKYMIVVSSKEEFDIVTIKLNRPEKHNAINLQMISELKKKLEEARDDQTIRCVIITGNGNSFSAGGDISEMTDRFGKAIETNIRLDTGLNQVVRLIRSIKRPVIAAINGACYGAGFVIATACDLIYATDKAKFGFAYGNIGLIPEASYFITRYLGLIKAKELVFFRKAITAVEALKLGLVNDVFDNDNFPAKISDLSKELAHGPVKTFGLAKDLLNAAFESPLHTQLQIEALSQSTAFTTDEHKEGVDAFLSKRKPDFLKL